MASAVESLTQGTTYENPVTFYDYYNAYGKDHSGSNWINADPNGLSGRVQDFFKGTASSARQAYDMYLSQLESAYNKAREDTAYSRSIEDIKRAGYNPFLGLGNISAAGSSAAESLKGQTKQEKANMNSALKLLLAFLMLARY